MKPKSTANKKTIKLKIKPKVKEETSIQKPRIKTDNILFRFNHKHTVEMDNKLKAFLPLHCTQWLFHKENLDKNHKKVKEHYHVWVESLIKSKRKSFSDAFSKAFPELKRKGRGGAHQKSQIKHLMNPIQFYYNFKNIKYEKLNQIQSSMPIKIELREFYLSEYYRLCQLAKSSSKFYSYYLDHNLAFKVYPTGEKKYYPELKYFSQIYIDYCIEYDVQRIHPNDQIFKYNYVLSKINKDQLLKLLKNNLHEYICRNDKY